jgi:hypothetical protein
MKRIIFGLNMILALSALCFAQQQDSKKINKTVKGETGAAATGQTGSGLGGLQAGTSLEAQLEQTLDVKKANVGDQVVMKLTKSVKQNGRTVVEKGSRLFGRVTEVQQKTKENAISRLGVVFDRIQGQNLNLPINASIVSISQTGAGAGAGDTVDTDLMAGSSSSSTISQSSARGGSSGLLGGATGVVGGVANTATSTVGTTAGTVANTTRQTVGTVNTAGGTTQTLGRTINGINIAPSAGASAQGGTTLSAVNKNLRLEKGAAFQLQVNGSARSN